MAPSKLYLEAELSRERLEAGRCWEASNYVDKGNYCCFTTKNIMVLCLSVSLSLSLCLSLTLSDAQSVKGGITLHYIAPHCTVERDAGIANSH